MTGRAPTQKGYLYPPTVDLTEPQAIVAAHEPQGIKSLRIHRPYEPVRNEVSGESAALDLQSQDA